MAGRDNVVFSAVVGNATAAGTVVPLSFTYGVENVRTGRGTPVLKNVRALFDGIYSAGVGIPVEIKNSNWVDSAGLVAQLIDDATALNKDSLAYMAGRDVVLAPNTSWTINAKLPGITTSAGTLYVILEIEYSDVAGYDPAKLTGAPVLKTCSNASVTGSANVPISIGSFDNLLQGVTYVLSEASLITTNADTSLSILCIEGFSNQKGLVRAIPIKATGQAVQIEGSVYLTKQTYSLALIRNLGLSSAAVTINLELIASKN